MEAWFSVLSKRTYERERDAPRIRAAFERLLEERTSWPQPADFLAAMPRSITTSTAPVPKRLSNDRICTRGLMHTSAIIGEMRLDYDGGGDKP